MKKNMPEVIRLSLSPQSAVFSWQVGFIFTNYRSVIPNQVRERVLFR